MTRSNQHSPVRHVALVSNGGPYDDDAYTAGYEVGVLFTRFSLRHPKVPMYAPTALLPQVDLLAMAFGYELSHFPTEPGWVFLVCTYRGHEAMTPENAAAPPLAPPSV